ncbi:thiocyanate hydrolase [Mycobacterium heckeshornense]|uniref:Thiocyanate hydrolase subunit beta n=1 Tax=Mycobacterium heckeshornense TaxID=110505 RepID=A0A2G8B8I7_9MYCO|nr:hypothetical protein [Mycobacterium heckeshornense]KMV22135.1 thiocyanate hydrolase [Mycobacterium heckeshornense]MCV7033270.1 thiocyanate hydrolase [Mycobacterium heckeshornense]PIJ34022.1 thiocyanate hydrolase [Mycobacterium heckeshornense]BCO37409.1 thiocyanate hydrolase subunit beta [Mycobacterium heckeshornense]BCQ10286.1 thiocyanate hydrolase subunit beta [Mycobacterium heckeshornense]
MPDDRDVSNVRVQTLERIAAHGQVWSQLASKYGVGNPVPPWKSSLDAMCDALDREGITLPLLIRRHDEDRLSDQVYKAVPFPESQLLALAHSLIARNVIDEAALADRMELVRARLESR